MECKSGRHPIRSDSIGSYDAYKELEEPSSIDLLRTSIIRSIRKREYESQNFHEKKCEGLESSLSKTYSSTKYTVLEVKHLDDKKNRDESDVSDLELSTSAEEDKFKSTHHRNSQASLTSEINSNNPLSINSSEPSDDLPARKITNKVENGKTKDSKNENDSDQNGLKLARRKFSDTIYEDCSTYSISCSRVNLRDEHDGSFGRKDSSICGESASIKSAGNDDKSSTKSEKAKDDQALLCDTFFTRVNDEEDYQPTCSSAASTESSIDGNTIANNNVDVIESESDIDVGPASKLPAKRKHSRRHRKRSRRKSKTKKSFVYECSKCGVSYVIPNKKMSDVACCLHCDLWTPVEPVFIKREKTTWNTCRIC